MNFIDQTRELSESNYLIQHLKDSGWMDRNVILVNCSPQFSSRLTQYINHKTSYLNNNQPYEQINLDLPLKNESQVWSYDDRQYLSFDKYIYNWINKHVIFAESKYLFITNNIFSGKNLNKVRLLMNSKTGQENFRFLTTYIQEGSVMKPDFWLKKFLPENPPVYFWENKNLPEKKKTIENY